MTAHVETLGRLGACEGAVEWVVGQDGSAYALWRRCDRGDWLLWLAGALKLDRKLIVLAACDCAETALVHVPAGEVRPREAIETALAWVDGKATLAQVGSAAYAAAYAAGAAANASVDAAVDAAADAAAYAAYAAADDAADDAARSEARATCARLIRKRIPWRLYRDALAEVAT